MIVPTSKIRNVRIAPKATLFGDAAVPGAGDIASSELLGAAVYRIKRLFMRHPPTREPRRPALAILPTRGIADCHHSRRPAVNVGVHESGMAERCDAVGWRLRAGSEPGKSAMRRWYYRGLISRVLIGLACLVPAGCADQRGSITPAQSLALLPTGRPVLSCRQACLAEWQRAPPQAARVPGRSVAVLPWPGGGGDGLSGGGPELLSAEHATVGHLDLVPVSQPAMRRRGLAAGVAVARGGTRADVVAPAAAPRAGLTTVWSAWGTRNARSAGST